MSRPFLWLALWYSLGIVAAGWLSPPLLPLFAAAVALAGASLWLPQARRTALPLLLGMAGAIHYQIQTAPFSPRDLRRQAGPDPVFAELQGRLVETPIVRSRRRGTRETHTSTARLEVRALRLQGKGWVPARGTVLTRTPGLLPEGFHGGREVAVSGVLAPPLAAAAPGLFDARRHLASQGIYYQLDAAAAREWRREGPGGAPPWSDRFISWARAALAAGLPAQDSILELEWAMALGWRPGLTPEAREPFLQAGTLHLFAISGLHIAMIALLLVMVLQALRVPRPWCGWLVIPLLWGYTAATGWQPSAVRATVMMSWVIAGWMLRRPADAFNTLCGAAFLILLWEPQQLFQASFQLSFLVVLSLLLLVPPLQERWNRWIEPDPLLPPELLPRWRQWINPLLRGVGATACTALAAWIGSLPLAAHYFHLVSPGGLLANLAVVPLSGLSLACNLGAMATYAWAEPVAVLLNHSGWFFMACMDAISRWAAALPGGYLHVQSPGSLVCAAYYLLLLGGCLGAAPGVRPLLAAGGALLGLTLSVSPLGSRQSLWAFSHQGADLLLDESRRVLVDCGNAETCEWLVEPFLKTRGINRLQALVLTHGDAQQMGGAPRLVERFPAAEVVISPVRFRSTVYRKVLDTLENDLPKPPRTVARGDQVHGWEILHPDRSFASARADDAALALALDTGGFRILFLGDLSGPGQQALLSDVQADVVILSKPASGAALSESLVEILQPRVLLLMDSRGPFQSRNRSPDPAPGGRPALRASEHGLFRLDILPGRECRIYGWQEGAPLELIRLPVRRPEPPSAKARDTAARQASRSADP